MSDPMTSPHPITIAFQVGQQHASYAENRRAWREAEELGVDVLYNWDHLLPPTGDPGGQHLESYTLLAAMAEGKSNQGIAETLFVTEAAVEKHVTSIFHKLRLEPAAGEHRRVRAVLRYLQDATG